MDALAKTIIDEAKALSETITADRRRLHSCPETGTDLPNTTEYVKNRLIEMRIEPQEICKSGITATISGGDNGKCMLLRADMDALKIKEATKLDFKSDNGNMHACGHDMHTAKQQIIDFIKNNVEPYYSAIADLTDEENKKQVGVVSTIVLPNDIRNDYKQLIKSPLYGFTATNKIRIGFVGWINRKPNDSFDRYCDEYCSIHNSKFIPVSFEELLERMLK